MQSRPVVLVTGGSRGIGRGICLALARTGFAVVVNYQGNEAAAQETRDLVGDDNCVIRQGDVSQAADRARIVEQTLSDWGRIDLLVNNAGITSVGRKDLLEATEESWDAVLGVNLKGPFFLTQSVAREMIRLRPSIGSHYRPTIINITSVSAYALSMNRGDYCVSKGGLSLASRLWALRLADEGIRVYEVRPGIVESDMTAGAHEKYTRMIAEGLTPIRRWGTPEDVGRAVAMLAAGELPYSTGEIINVDGGFHLRAFPR